MRPLQAASHFLAMAAVARASYVDSLPSNAQELFSESMSWMDTFYDTEAGYLYDLSAQTALDHETRSSAWYALGLLARNEDDNVQQAEKIVNNIISGQFRNESQQWYGDYQKFPEEPAVGVSAYPSSIYNSWDPNWRGFVGTTFIMILEEFPALLSPETISAIESSLYLTAVGDTYRVGGVDSDNLYPSYSNPAIMRAFTSIYVGLSQNASNLTAAGETEAHEIIDLFSRANTLAEFNSGTYTGVSLFALTMWVKYLPEDHFMHQEGKVMIAETWRAVGQLWHAGLKNMAGPWDRAYGFDMRRYLSLLALWFWVVPEVGKEAAGLPRYPQVLSHSADYAWGPLFAVLADFHTALIPTEVLPKLTTFAGEHTFNSSAFSPPWDLVPRNISAWLADGISIGAESFEQTVVGGAVSNPSQFSPAAVQWDTGDGGIGFISWYATEPSLTATVSPYSLTLSYPRGNASSIFSLIVSPFKRQPTVSSWADLVGLRANIMTNFGVDGSSSSTYNVTYGGRNGGADEPINDFEFWNFTYVVPEGVEAPMLRLELELV
ncbi:uncharacterized protein HMPREF1541_05314 [Cyphellophora europaea CBS 101466]|uniref:Linalool dehydratase/isomerase domain-containing protein n=1 Tax=Cyphellophora europaea (strain CBS 101466) TaxID=1220924 RepID=W2RRK1_CYPE1|nr:uncharacterized protein HMPREF1541_05314 [Cyphellophora europaea CBS 101466]ETN39092.1 hypothetical protein HMPREF1541_05314 [Cyphellophora europaea CBS 101466]